MRRALRGWIPLAAGLALIFLIPSVRGTIGHGFALLATGQLGQFQQFLRSLGAWAPLVSIALMIAGSLAVPIPVTIIMVANGLVFGVWGGMLVSFAGGLSGALAAYLVGRTVGRAVVSRLLPASSLRAADGLMARHGRWAVVLERWIPGVPGDPMSYASGLTHMPVGVFLLMTTIGLVPANLVTAWVGNEVAGDIPLHWWLTGIAFAVAVWLAIRLIRKPGRSSPAQ